MELCLRGSWLYDNIEALIRLFAINESIHTFPIDTNWPCFNIQHCASILQKFIILYFNAIQQSNSEREFYERVFGFAQDRRTYRNIGFGLLRENGIFSEHTYCVHYNSRSLIRWSERVGYHSRIITVAYIMKTCIHEFSYIDSDRSLVGLFRIL